ncbi:HNH endonuclease [Nostoc sp.]|uniref:HNH endonuclease n=1 Tax=Nostoc sp. TaxID=1180 RepID=UPI003FA57274
MSPYRGSEDNHPDNGLLLRADLHTLFDLDLLGIHPESLQIQFHPKVLTTSYKKLDGRKLICSEIKPSQLALESRWRLFLKRL